MGKQVKKSLALVMCLVMMVASMPLSGFVGLELPDWSFDFSGMFDITASAVSDDSGSCGTSVYYTFDSASGTLTISGSGDMTDYISFSSYSSMPWYSYRTSITSVVIESEVASIGSYAFYYCTSLTSITIPDSVTSIGYYAFSYCTSLTCITIPDSVTTIGSSAFIECIMLSSVKLSKNWNCVGYNRVYAIDRVSPFYGCTSLTSIEIPEGATTIPDDAFVSCTSLTSITIPDSVRSIGDSALSYCTSLTSITIPDSVTTIEEKAFYKTGWYNNQDDGVLYLDNWVICYKGDYTEAIDITLKDGTVGIANNAFYECSKLTSITIPDSVTSIGAYAFYNTGWYNNQDDGVLYLNNWVICYKGDYSESVSITLQEGTIGIADSAFSFVYFDEYFIGLINITIPDSVKFIGDFAFAFCTSLTDLFIPNSVISIGDYAFACCANLTSFTVDSNNQYYLSENDVLFNKDKTVLIQYSCCKSDSSYIIPNTVVDISDYAFFMSVNLTSIIIPDSVTSIGSWAFCMCTSLTSITITNLVTSIGDVAFCYCENLETVYFYGTPEEYATISVGSDNEYFTSANVIYIYDEENIDSADTCSCACHSTGFIKFIFDFLTFFRQIFGMTQYQVCGCGVYHW